MTFFLLDGVVEERERQWGAGNMADACMAEGVPFKMLFPAANDDVVRFSNGLHRHGVHVRTDDVVARGSKEFFSGWYAHCSGLGEDWTKPFEYSSYAPTLKDLLLNNYFALMPFGCIDEYAFEMITSSGKMFMKPNSTMKSFTGFVIEEDKLDHELSSLRQIQRIRNDELVVIAPAWDILAEYRFVVVGNKVVAGSEYRWDNKLDIRKDYPNGAMQVAEKAAALLCPDNGSHIGVDGAIVIDVAEIYTNPLAKPKEKGFRVIEINPFNTSGLYACDRRAIVRAIYQRKVDSWEKFADTRFV